MEKYKKVPSYWWDFEDPNVVIVESDHKDFPVVAEFKYDPMDGDGDIWTDDDGRQSRYSCAEEAIEKAEEHIKKLNEGRITPKNRSKL